MPEALSEREADILETAEGWGQGGGGAGGQASSANVEEQGGDG